MSKLAAYGCSHTGTYFGTPWAEFLAEKMDMELFLRSSPGGNVGNHLDKLNVDLQNEDIDLIVLQLSQYFRLTLGFKHHENRVPLNPHEDGFTFGNLGYYTFAADSDDSVFSSNLRFELPKYAKGIHRFIAENIVTSNWMREFAMQQLYTFVSLCREYDKPVYIFSWDEPMTNDPRYKKGSYINNDRWLHILDYNKLSYLNQSLNGYEGWFKKNDIKPLPDGHYGTEAHKAFVDEVLYDRVKDFYTNI